MAFQGPSIIGANYNLANGFPTIYTVGTIIAAGSNSVNKLQIINSSGFAVFTVDTQSNLLDVGASIIPTGTTYNIGSALNPFNYVYCNTLSAATVTFTGASANQVVQTDSSGNLKTSNTLPTNVLATNMSLTNPSIDKISNLTANGFVKTSSSNGSLSIDTNTYLLANNPTWTGTMSTPLTASSIVQTNSSSQLTASNIFPATVRTLSIQPNATSSYAIGTSGLFYTNAYVNTYYVLDSNTTISNSSGDLLLTAATGKSVRTANNFTPSVTATYTCGDSSHIWSTLYVSTITSVTGNLTVSTPISAGSGVLTNTLGVVSGSQINVSNGTAIYVSSNSTISYPSLIKIGNTSSTSSLGVNGCALEFDYYNGPTFSSIIATAYSTYLGINGTGSASAIVTNLTLGDSSNIITQGYIASAYVNNLYATVTYINVNSQAKFSSTIYVSNVSPYSGSQVQISVNNSLQVSSNSTTTFPSLLYIANVATTGSANANGCALEFDYYNASTASSIVLTARGIGLTITGSGSASAITTSLTCNFSTVNLSNLSSTGSITCSANLTFTATMTSQITNSTSGSYTICMFVKNSYTGSVGTSGDVGIRFVENGTGYDIVCNEYGNFYPGANNTYTWGKSSNYWLNIHTAGLTMYGGMTTQAVVPTGDNTYNIGAASNRYSLVYAYTLNVSSSTIYGASNNLILQPYGSDVVPYGNCRPYANNSFTLGSGSYTWSTIYGQTLNLNGDTIYDVSGNIVLKPSSADVVPYANCRPYFNNTYNCGTSSYVWAGVYATKLCSDNWYNVAGTYYFTFTLGKGFQTNASLLPVQDNANQFGASNLRWTTLYAVTGTINTSDAREKNTITPVSEDMGLNFINSLKPVSYKWDVRQNFVDDAGNVMPLPGIRTHYGLISQDVKAAMDKLKMTSDDFAGFIYDAAVDKYGLRYDEFISPMIKAIQQLSSEIEAINSRLANISPSI
jgi:hypothetical protein